MGHFKRTQQKYVKKSYRVRNWREYEAGLRKRGSLTVWIKDVDTVTGKIFWLGCAEAREEKGGPAEDVLEPGH